MIVIKVAVAVILNPQKSQICLTQRQKHQHYAGLWEFPGGKCHNSETSAQALQRELAEEIGIQATDYRHFESVIFQQTDCQINIDFYWVEQYQGQTVAQEGQRLAWVPIDTLYDYPMPPANREVLNKVVALLT